MSELQTLESIIKGKPEGMSYFAQLEAPVNKDIYLDDCMMINEIAIFSKDDNKFIAVDSDSVCIDAIINMRSLADIEKQIDQLKEIERLKVVNLTLIEHILRLSEKYADLKIESDANQWAHDNMQEQLANSRHLRSDLEFYNDPLSGVNYETLHKIKRLEEQLVSANLEATRKGFWLGFEDARCHPQENNILMQWESTLIFTQSKQLEGKG